MKVGRGFQPLTPCAVHRGFAPEPVHEARHQLVRAVLIHGAAPRATAERAYSQTFQPT
jgi:hypothetical protein